MPRIKNRYIFAALAIVLLAAGCVPAAGEVVATATPIPTRAAPTETPADTATPLPSATATPVPTPTLTSTPLPITLSGAGDIVECGYDGAAQTAALLQELPGEIFTAGDNSNDSGRAVEYRNCYAPTWGLFMNRLHPSPGNHDYGTKGGQPYYDFFGTRAGVPGKGWYSYDLGDWHIVALNTNCDQVSCKANSEQVEWLRQDLQSHASQCTLAYYHHPRWSSGLAGSLGWIAPLFKTLYDNGVDVVVNGHDHDYERIAPLDPDGNPDPQHGVRSFVVGTGGAALRNFSETILPSSEDRIDHVFGVIKFTLYPDHYDWAFLPAGGGPALDSGSDVCR